jgi:hypothetical protein
MYADARGELCRCQPRQRSPGANHTGVGATAALPASGVFTNESALFTE